MLPSNVSDELLVGYDGSNGGASASTSGSWPGLEVPIRKFPLQTQS
jgi:hypothetical protein